MSSKEAKSGVVVRDRRGVLYAIPADVAKQYIIGEEDFESAAAFYTSEEDDVTGQMYADERDWLDGVPDDALINRPLINIRF